MSICPHPGRLDDGQCVSGKRVYYAAKLANRAITEAAKRGELPTMRHYACPHCGWWHLSRKNRLPRVLGDKA